MKKLGFIIPALMVLAGCAYELKEVEALRAGKAAQQYAATFQQTFVSCSGQDSTSDGYVSCTLKDKDNNPVTIECSYATSEAGCKPKKS